MQIIHHPNRVGLHRVCFVNTSSHIRLQHVHNKQRLDVA